MVGHGFILLEVNREIWRITIMYSNRFDTSQYWRIFDLFCDCVAFLGISRNPQEVRLSISLCAS